MDEDLSQLTWDQLIAKVKKLRKGIREYRDSSGYEPDIHRLTVEATGNSVERLG
jgi:hypothetical protein